MAVYRTAQGKMIDMAALASKNEKTRAVGNMKNVNARGDIIDREGNIIQPVNEKVNDQYTKTVGSKYSKPMSPTNNAPSRAAPKTNRPPINQLTEAERELEDSFEDDLEIEQIKENEVKKRK